MLDSREKEWNAKQKALQVARIEQKMSLSTKKKDYTKNSYKHAKAGMVPVQHRMN